MWLLTVRLILAKLVAEIAKDHSWCQQLQMWRDLTRFVYTAYISAPIKVLAYTVCASLPWPPFCSTKRLYSRRPGRRQIELFEIKVDVHPSKRDFEEDDHVQQHERYREEHTQQATDRRRHPVSHAGVHFSRSSRTSQLHRRTNVEMAYSHYRRCSLDPILWFSLPS